MFHLLNRAHIVALNSTVKMSMNTSLQKLIFYSTTTTATATKKKMIKVGDSLPSVNVYEDTPAKAINIAELFKGKKGILFGVPGAFTPGCSKTHLPGYVTDFEKLKAKGVDIIACVSVNDPFVMQAWGENQKAADKVRMLADTKAELANAMGLAQDLTDKLGGVRFVRFSAVIDNGVVKALNVEEGGGMSCSLSNVIYSQL